VAQTSGAAHAGELFNDGASETAAWLYAGIYVVCGVLGAWYLWYSRLYHACKGDRGLTFFFFFMSYSVHCAFCLWASLAPPGLMGEDLAFCGILCAPPLPPLPVPSPHALHQSCLSRCIQVSLKGGWCGALGG
jgi:hypothetical protein